MMIRILSILFFLISSPAVADSFIKFGVSVDPPIGAKNLCQNYSWACESISRNVDPHLVDIIDLNFTINHSVSAISDEEQYGISEYWSLPGEKGGDCEDYVLLKKYELIKRGVNPRNLLIATVLDKNKTGHAVLVVRSRNGDVVLDNLTDSVKLWNHTDYIFLRVQDPSDPEKWRRVYQYEQKSLH